MPMVCDAPIYISWSRIMVDITCRAVDTATVRGGSRGGPGGQVPHIAAKF